MCAKFGRGPTVVSKKGAQTGRGTLQLYIVDTLLYIIIHNADHTDPVYVLIQNISICVRCVILQIAANYNKSKLMNNDRCIISKHSDVNSIKFQGTLISLKCMVNKQKPVDRC